MSLKAHFASLSLGASVDQQTGNLSVFDVVDEVRVPQVPVHLQSLIISIAFHKTQKEAFRGKVLIHIFTPDGKQQMVGNGELHVPEEQSRVKAVFRFGGFPVYNFGHHRFVVSWLNDANTKVGETLLDFEAIQVQQVGQGVGPGPGGSAPKAGSGQPPIH